MTTNTNSGQNDAANNASTGDPAVDREVIQGFAREVRIALAEVDNNPYDMEARVQVIDMLVNRSAAADAAYERAFNERHSAAH